MHLLNVTVLNLSTQKYIVIEKTSAHSNTYGRDSWHVLILHQSKALSLKISETGKEAVHSTNQSRMYEDIDTRHRQYWTQYQVLNCYECDRCFVGQIPTKRNSLWKRPILSNGHTLQSTPLQKTLTTPIPRKSCTLSGYSS